MAQPRHCSRGLGQHCHQLLNPRKHPRIGEKASQNWGKHPRKGEKKYPRKGEKASQKLGRKHPINGDFCQSRPCISAHLLVPPAQGDSGHPLSPPGATGSASAASIPPSLPASSMLLQGGNIYKYTVASPQQPARRLRCRQSWQNQD